MLIIGLALTAIYFLALAWTARQIRTDYPPESLTAQSVWTVVCGLSIIFSITLGFITGVMVVIELVVLVLTKV